jgi:hypothetical protein
MTDDGVFADSGDYRVTVVCEDATGSRSVAMHALLQVYY